MTEYATKYELPLTTQAKMRTFFEQQAKMDGGDGGWERVFEELPPSLKTDVVQATHGQIIKGIIFFKDKP
jgi:hypothetical protein